LVSFVLFTFVAFSFLSFFFPLPSYLERLNDYLRVFIHLHIHRLEALTPTMDKLTVDEFLRLVLAYAFAQPSTDKFFSAMEVWRVFLDYVQSDNDAWERRPDRGGVMAVVRYGEILFALADKILHKVTSLSTRTFSNT
jgi:hypothetical protein